MKANFISIMLVMLMIATSQVIAQSGQLRVLITGIREVKGDIRVGLFNTEETFLKKVTKGQTVKAELDKVSVSFENVPPGEYAISVIHDSNQNGELDSNFLGMPEEGFGFGNNAMGTFGPPSFEKAKVTWDGKDLKVEIKLRYL